MNVSSSSWHYRLWRLGRKEYPRSEPRDLCRYFWHIFTLKVMLPLIVVLLALSGIVALIWVTFTHPLDVLVVVGTIVLTIGAIAGGTWVIVELVERHKERKDREERGTAPAKEPGPIKTYLKARKAKLCPLITVTNPDSHE